jgi:hypothetical protein
MIAVVDHDVVFRQVAALNITVQPNWENSMVAAPSPAISVRWVDLWIVFALAIVIAPDGLNGPQALYGERP